MISAYGQQQGADVNTYIHPGAGQIYKILSLSVILIPDRAQMFRIGPQNFSNQINCPSTLTTLTYFCLNHGNRRVFSIKNYHKCFSYLFPVHLNIGWETVSEKSLKKRICCTPPPPPLPTFVVRYHHDHWKDVNLRSNFSPGVHMYLHV